MRLIYFFLFSVCTAYAQDSLLTNELQNLIITDEKLRSHNNSQLIHILSDSLIDESIGSFTDLLLFNSSIYFKENGAGMVSSPSFRGTTAQQTAVLWNGIEVNSLFLGQTDFNSISYKEYNEIGIKAGGGSVLYGSGAIGGTIHLNNKVRFSPHFDQQIQLSAGSFETYGINYAISAGDNRWFIQANYNRNQSKNDFKVKNRHWKNTNGAYENNSLSATLAYRINRFNKIQLLSNYYFDNRHFALISPNQIKSKYNNETARNLFVWEYNNRHIVSNFRVGYLYESYRFVENIRTNTFTGGAVNTLLAKHDFDYQIQEKLRLSSVIYLRSQQNEGENSSMEESKQNILSLALLGTYEWKEGAGIEAGLKKEWSNYYHSPLLFSAGWYQKFSNKYTTKVNVSRNYRAPTLNDMFWQPGGNKNLESENSYQIDWGHTLNLGKITLNTNLYWIEISDMIRWIPTESGLWKVKNTDKVLIKGIETNLQMPIENKWLPIKFNFGYSYNESIDKSTNKLLTYTPKHKIFGGLMMNYRNFTFRLQGYFNGKVYTTTSNSKNYEIQPYGLLNSTIGYQLNSHLSLFGTIRNLTDSHYENVENRPMPGRNYNVKLLINL